MTSDLDYMKHIAKSVGNAADTVEQEQHSNEYNQYSQYLRDNPDSPTLPQGMQVNAPVWNKAVTDHISTQLKQGDLSKQRMENIKSQLELKRQGLIDNAQRAESLVATNAEAAIASYMQSYTDHPNGITTKYNEQTGDWDFTDQMTGETWAERVTLDQARQMTQALLAPGEYEKVYLTDRSRVVNYNKVAAINPDLLQDVNGKKLSMFTMIDPNNGQKVLKYQDEEGNQMDLSAEDILRGGFRIVADRQKDRLAELGVAGKEGDVQKTQADIRHQDAQTAQIQKETSMVDAEFGLKKTKTEADAEYTRSMKGTGGPQKYLEAMMSAYGIDRATAMDIVRKDKNFGPVFRQAMDQAEGEYLDPSDPDDAERFQEIMRDFGVDKLPGQEGYGGHKPSPGAGENTSQLPTNLPPAAKSSGKKIRLKDGRIIQSDGKQWRVQ